MNTVNRGRVGSLRLRSGIWAFSSVNNHWPSSVTSCGHGDQPLGMPLPSDGRQVGTRVPLKKS